MNTIQEILKQGKSLLRDYPQPALEAKVLLLKATSLPEKVLHTSPETKLSRKQRRQFLKLLSRRRAGIPLAYLTGYKEFWSIPFCVNHDVLIPRPETELIVENVLKLAGRNNETIVDLGTGCGNLAVALAKELPEADIIATDISRKALKMARLNAELQGMSRVRCVRGSLFSPLENLGLRKKCDFIVSNPPYVTELEWEALSDGIKNYEPKKALVAGKTGLEVIDPIVKNAPGFLKRGGFLVLEIGQGQKEQVLPLFGAEWKSVKSHDDLAGIPRVIVAKKK